MLDITEHPTTTLAPADERLAAAGRAANAAADRSAFTRYQARRPASTLTAQRHDLERFVRYLADTGLSFAVDALFRHPTAWSGITHGLVAAFVQWQLNAGYAVASINRALATVKRYSGLAGEAIDPVERARIQQVQGIGRKDQRAIDEGRAAAQTPTRVSTKKATPTAISHEQAAALKQHPDTPQGRRDTLLLCLLLDHGLRESEVYDLAVTAFDLKRGTMTFYRRKVNITQTHKLSADTLRAATVYLRQDAPALGRVLRSSRKGGDLTGPITISAIKRRVRFLGNAVGLDTLSPHDCRHYWATAAAERGVNPLRLQEAGGWASLEMPRRYVAASEIANDGMV